MADITLVFGTHEDKSWMFFINGFDLTNHTLRSQIRVEDTQVLIGSFVASQITATSFKLSISKLVSGAIAPGEYVSDILATSTIDGLATFITPILKVIVTNRVTEPV